MKKLIYFLRTVKITLEGSYSFWDSINLFLNLLIILIMHHKEMGSNVGRPQDAASSS